MHVQYEIYILYIRRYKYTHTPPYISAYIRLCVCICMYVFRLGTFAKLPTHFKESKHQPASAWGVAAALALLTADIGMKCLANSFLYTNTHINSLK